MIDGLNKEELLELIEKSEHRIAEIDKQEAEKANAPVILQVGKTYKTKSGESVMIIRRNISIYTGLNKNQDPKSIERYPEFYIDGRRSKNKLSDGDLIEEINNG